MNDDDDADEGADLPSPSGRTTFVLAHAHGESSTISVRRRPGLLFAQHMGLLAGPSASGSSQPAKLGARLGAGIGMGGGLRQTHHDDNPFLDAPSTVGPSSSADRAVPPSPDRFTSYVPQALRLSAERSLSPHPRARPRKHARLPDRVARPALVDDPNNPFVARTGEVVRARPTSEDHPLVTYVFRGAKRVFANPFIHPSTSYPPAELDPSHEDYDPHPCPPPRLLWPSKEPSPPKTPPRAPPRRRRREEMEMEEEEESDEEDGMFARRGLLFSQADVPAKRPRLDGL
jgi:hypothetical protein